MDKSNTFTLGKNERLKRRKAIDLLFTNGKAFTQFPFRVVYVLELPKKQNDLPEDVVISKVENLQAAFSVSKKYFKKAVHRNRIKRLMKETYRLQKNELKLRLQTSNKRLQIFIIYLGKEISDYKMVSTKMNEVIFKLLKISDEAFIANT